MISPIDKLITKFLHYWLHPLEKDVVSKAMIHFKEHYPQATDEQRNALEGRLVKEKVRIFPLVDEAILNATVTRAKYTFWFIALFSTLLIGALGGFTSGKIFPFFSPGIMALLSWVITWATIPVTYSYRIKGAMMSIIASYADETFRIQDAANSLAIIIPILQQAPNEFDKVSENEEYSPPPSPGSARFNQNSMFVRELIRGDSDEDPNQHSLITISSPLNSNGIS